MLPNTPEDIVSKLRMFRSRYPSNSLVLVEGQTDQALWSEYKADRCSLIPAGNKEKAVRALEISNTKTSLHGVAAVIDPDYWLIDQPELLKMDNLLHDDSPDMEIMLLNTPALEKVMRHTFVYVETDQIHQFANSLRTEALRLAAEFGYYRLLDFRHREYNLMLRRVADNFVEYIDEQTLQYRSKDVAETLLAETSAPSVPELLTQVEALKVQNSLRMVLCRGKDAISLVAIILPLQFKRVFNRDMSQKSLNQTTGNELTRSLRMAFEVAHFAVTKIYERICKWERDNPKFKILAEDMCKDTAS